MTTKKPIDRLRAIALALPEAYEEETWDELAELVADSYRLIAPKKLSALID
jgi:hypothetical protein